MPNKEIFDSKKKTVDELSKIFECDGVYLFDYRGLTVKEMGALRREVKGLGGNVKVFKNRLAIKYFQKNNLEVGRDVFNGPLAVSYANNNFIEVAKAMVDFEKENPKIRLRAGFIERSYLDTDGIKAVAKLPSKEQLLAQLVMSISMPLRKMGMALSAPLSTTLILMKNLKDKREQEEKQ